MGQNIFLEESIPVQYVRMAGRDPIKPVFGIENKALESIKVQHKKTNQPTHNDRLQNF
jgi:hypothetical protein